MTDNDRKEIEKMIRQAVITKEEIKQDIINPLLAIVNAYHEGDLKLINADLKMILEQTTKHNQRMTKIEIHVEDSDKRVVELEKKEIAHVLNCPYNEDIRKLQDEALSVRSVKKWATKTIIISVAVVTIVSGLIGIFINLFVIKP